MFKILKTLFLISITLGLLSFEIKKNNEDAACKILHEGTFKYGGIKDEIKVVIKDSSHTEYHSGGKYIIESDIEWINDCEYNMTLKKVTIPNFPYSIGDVMNVKIKNVNGNEISYVSSVKGTSWPGRLIKISN